MPIVIPSGGGGVISIVDYASLVTAVADWIHRTSDSALVARVPDFVALFEAEANDRLLLKDMESTEPLTLVTNQDYIALPSGFISPIAFWLMISGLPFQLGSPVFMQDLPYSTAASIPRNWAIDGANILFNCPASSAYSAFLRCVKKSNLSGSNTTNALLLHRPDVYLYGSLEQAALFTNNDAAATKWGAFKERSIRSLKAADSRSKSIVQLRTDIGSGRRANILEG